MSDGAAAAGAIAMLLLGSALGAAAGVWGWEAWGREALGTSDEEQVTSEVRVPSVAADVAALDAKLDHLCNLIDDRPLSGCGRVGFSSESVFSKIEALSSQLNSADVAALDAKLDHLCNLIDDRPLSGCDGVAFSSESVLSKIEAISSKVNSIEWQLIFLQ